jgi:signal transduction histidine kinase/FixJ family two-component response regulator
MMDKPIIVVVDDEQGIAILCERLLSRAGFRVSSYTNPRQAMQYLQHNQIDLLLVDIRMPEVDGFDVISFARDQQPDMAVLVMTGFGTVETAIQALRQGVDGLLLKPFEEGEELVQAVQQALVDRQKKQDAARVQALRPLFDATESLLAETRPDHLLGLIVHAVRIHLQCSNVGYYVYSQEEERLHLLVGEGITFPEGGVGQVNGIIGQVDANSETLWLNANGPGDPELKKLLGKYKLNSVLCVPILRPRIRSVLYAARNVGESSFREVDQDMLTILARQAAIAMENAYLYEEWRDYVEQVEDSQQALVQAEKMAAAGRLTASIAHEINNPLQSLQNCLHLAGRDDVPQEKRDEYFNLANSELDRLMGTVQRMLDFYRPGGADLGEVLIGEVLMHVIGLTEQQLSKGGIKIDVNIAQSLPVVHAVGGQLQQVFINLILNSLDAMPTGGVLKITARQVKGGIEILFQDSGLGILPEHQENIFEPFFSTKSGGTGLGLTVSYNIISSHGGTLDLVDGRGTGACFRVFLPVGVKK